VTALTGGAVPTILIVDDNADMRHALRFLFESVPGCTVSGDAATGQEAIEKAAELQPDVVVLDFCLPEMNGLQTAQILKDLLPTVAIFMLTGHREEIGGTAEQLGLQGIFSKSGDFQSMIQEVCAEPRHRSTDALN
jgi:DNA-binding NarL/FixJ family response regulator